MIRVLVADDHDVLTEGLRQLLSVQPDIEVVGSARTGYEAIEAAAALSPDVVVMDVGMPGLNGIEAARRIRSEYPRCRIVILSMHSDSEHVRQAFRAGASGYVLKRAAAVEMLAAVRAAHAGARYLAPELAVQLTDEAAQPDPLETLSEREREVLKLLAESHSVRDIALRLGLSPKSVETYRERLMAKLDIRDLAGLVRFAVQRRLIALE